MYIEKDLKRGYNTYLSTEVNNGEGSYMDVGLLILEAGDTYTFTDPEKEMSWILLTGGLEVTWDDQPSVTIDRPDPFSHSSYCMLQARGHKSEIKALKYSEVYVQATANDRDYESHLYRPDEIHSVWLGRKELEGTMMREVRTVYDYESRPDSNMVLGEDINLGGRWSSYPPHHHPQPEVYFYYFEKEQGFGAGWSDGKPHQIGHHGLLLIRDDHSHPQAMAPGYNCCYIWGIRHLPDNPWEKTRIDEEAHTWLLADDPGYWKPELN